MHKKQHPSPAFQRRIGQWITPAVALAIAAGPLSSIAQTSGAWIEFSGEQTRPSLAIRVGGEDGTALLQPANAANAVSRTFADRVGLKEGSKRLSLTGVYGENEMPVAEDFDLMLAGTTMVAEDFLIVPDSMAAVDILLGQPLFQAAIVQIDYPQRRLRILPPGSIEFEGNAKIKMSESNRPLVRTSINGKDSWMLLDTNSRGICLLKNNFVGKHKLDRHAVELELTGDLAVEAGQAVQSLRLERFDLGPYGFENFLAAYSPNSELPIDSRAKAYGARRIVDQFQGDGVLGYEILRHFIVTVSLANEKVQFYAP